MEAKKFDPATALNYESSKNEAEHGHKYQRELAFMLFVRVALKGYKFKLFTELPEAGKFDDVAIKMIAILKQLLSMERVLLMISGRKHVQQQLQQLSDTIRFVNLVPFANKDQLDFLQKFWDVSKEDETTMAKFYKFAKQLLKTFHRGIKRSQYDFTGVPLMVRMLAEVYVENVEKFLQTDCETDGENYLPTTGFNEVTLYEQFVKKSFCMKMRKKFNLDAYITKQSFDGELKALFDQNTLEYQLAAIKELNIKELDDVVQEEHSNTYEEFLNRVGNGDDKSLLINTSGKTVRFVHLSFAEYFTAKCLCDYIERCKHILYPILEKQLVVRKFFFQLIEEISGETHTKCLGVLNKICELTPSVAFWACEAVCVNVTKSLFEHNALQNIRIDDYGTILHLAVSIDSREIVEYLLEDYGMDSNIVSNTEINPLADFVRNKQEFPEHMSIDENITPLIWAVYHGHANIVSLLLNHNADVNAKSNSKLTALHLAAQYGFLEIADVLLQTNKCNGNAQDEYGRTALHFAVNFNHIQIVRLLMNHSADLKLDLNAADSGDNTALHLAVLRNHTEVAKLLIGNPSVDINARNEDSIVPLHLAAEHGNSVIVELLVTRKASIDVLNSKKYTPLQKAAEKGHTNIVKILVANGANIKYTGKDTPLALAASSGNLETFEYLLVLVSAAEEDNAQIQQDVLWKAVGLDRVEIVRKLLDGYSVDVNDATGWGSTPLHDSASRGYTDVVRTLLDHGAVIDSRDSDNMTPLMKACNAGHEAIVKILLDKSANPNAQAFCQFTALHYATYSGHLGVVELLLDGGAEVNAIDDKQRTPLHLAATGSHEEIVKLLLLRSANQNLQDSNQDTPLHLAIRSQYTECSEMLINERTDFNLQNKKRWTPLHVAIRYERNKIVPQLILPENLNLPDIEGRTPLHLAVDKKSVENVKVLLNFSPDVKLNAQDNKQQTPLHVAAQHGNSEIVRQLLADSTTIIDVQDNKQQTPLHLAAQHGHSEIVRQLLAVSTTIIDVLDKGHNTALHLALQHVNGETAHLLIERSSKLEATNRNSETPLHLASQAGLDTAVRALIQKGVHLNPRDRMQRTPLHLAALRGHVDVVQVLIDNSAQVDVTDRNGRTPLKLAIESKKDDVDGDFHSTVRALTDAIIRSFPLFRYTPLSRYEKLQTIVSEHLPRSVYELFYSN
ncbi:hypothetical protein RP20_CCG013771 [Aedes albopictus]|nr:hypothetical protein RP20_CCG013771 [Aedes albopictus]